MQAVREWQAPYPVDVRMTLSVHRRGPRDPAFRVDESGSVWRTSLPPHGPGPTRVRAAPVRVGAASAQPVWPQRSCVRAAAWGPGAGLLLSQLPSMLGAEDD